MEEIFLQENSRIKLHKNEDRNNVFFHKSATMKQEYKKWLL